MSVKVPEQKVNYQIPPPQSMLGNKQGFQGPPPGYIINSNKIIENSVQGPFI